MTSFYEQYSTCSPEACLFYCHRGRYRGGGGGWLRARTLHTSSKILNQRYHFSCILFRISYLLVILIQDKKKTHSRVTVISIF